MIFIDTSGLYALVDKDAIQNPAAKAIFERLLCSDAKMVTTNYVVHELLALAQRRIGLPAVETITGDILPLVRTVFVDEALHQSGLHLLLAERRRHLSLTDCTSISFMRSARIAEAFAFDSDFTHFGIRTLEA